MAQMNGLHILVRSREELLALADAAERHLQPLGVNKLVAEIDDNFLFSRFPELSNGDISEADAGEFSRRCGEAGIEAIPLFNCLGHQGWKNDRNALLRAHPEFDETLRAGEGPDKADIYCPCWCAMDDGVYRYVFSAIDEILDAFGCGTLHVGMDEVFELGKCPRCSGFDVADLFARTVNILHAHLAARGVGMMMWGDRFLDSAVLGHTWEADALGIHPAVKAVPRDIVIADWHYERGAHPSAGILLDHGFNCVWPSCWRDGEAAVELLRDARAQAAARGLEDRVPGMLVTCWEFGPTRLLAALEGSPGAGGAERNFVHTLRKAMEELRPA